MNNIVDLACQLEETCRFCYPPEKERILYSTDNFYVMVSLGPIVEGYLLIVSKQHIPACANIPEDLIDEYLNLKEKVREVLTSAYGSCIFYEHGKTGACLIGKDHRHCFHAHLHCIPVKVSMSEEVSSEIEGHAFDSIKYAYDYARGCERYLYVEDSKIIVYTPSEKLRTQYLRYKLATSLGMTERWDWVRLQNWDLIKTTVDKLKTFFV